MILEKNMNMTRTRIAGSRVELLVKTDYLSCLGKDVCIVYPIHSIGSLSLHLINLLVSINYVNVIWCYQSSHITFVSLFFILSLQDQYS